MPSGSTGGREDGVMWQDLAALTPPLVVCAAFIIGLAMFLRHQMRSKHGDTGDDRRRPPNRRS